MFSIMWREFLSSFKSVKSLVTILIFLGVSLGLSKLVSNFYEPIKSLGIDGAPYAIAIVFMTILISPFFIFTLSHNTINEEIKSSTVRFIATKTRRINIVMGKFLGLMLFWCVTLFISSLISIVYSHHFYILELIISLIFISYYLSLSILISTFITNTTLTNFLGIALSLIMTILGVWSVASSNTLLKIYSYITPYHYYFSTDKYLTTIVLIFTSIFLITSIIKFQARDL
ncbi:TPA: ABC transporter permease [Staphylococcus pseudintermedius]